MVGLCEKNHEKNLRKNTLGKNVATIVRPSHVFANSSKVDASGILQLVISVTGSELKEQLKTYTV